MAALKSSGLLKIGAECKTGLSRVGRGARAMRIFRGAVKSGYGIARANLRPVMRLIESRMGMANLVEGTLNVQILEDYVVIPDASVLPDEYPLNLSSGLKETIKLQRCVIASYKAIIMRPDTHERGMFHGAKHLELIGAVNFRQRLELENESEVEVEVEGDDAWWAAAN
jgi:CTP-dependent riboflavin kinase